MTTEWRLRKIIHYTVCPAVTHQKKSQSPFFLLKPEVSISTQKCKMQQPFLHKQIISAVPVA